MHGAASRWSHRSRYAAQDRQVKHTQTHTHACIDTYIHTGSSAQLKADKKQIKAEYAQVIARRASTDTAITTACQTRLVHPTGISDFKHDGHKRLQDKACKTTLAQPTGKGGPPQAEI